MSSNDIINETEEFIFEVMPEHHGMRLDSFAAQLEIGLSRTAAVNLIEKGQILLNDMLTNKKCEIKAGDIVRVLLEPPHEISLVPQDIPLDIIYQDNDIAVINKPQGMVVHPAHGNTNGTLVNAIMYHIKDLSGINGEIRPGIVHRLDKDTSGVIIIAKNDHAHRALADQFKARTCEKKYIALAEGVFKKQHDTITAAIARDIKDRKKMALSERGKIAVTEYTVMEQYKDAAMVECLLHTGRTHQIRLHLASIGHPCLGDTVYGFKKNRFQLAGQALHSASLTILHPVSGEKMTFTAPLPPHISDTVIKLKKQ